MIRRMALASALAVLLGSGPWSAAGPAHAEPGNKASVSPVALTNTALDLAAAGDRAGAQSAVDAMPRDQAARVVALIADVDSALSFPLTDQVPVGVAPGAAVVILGFGLLPDGSLRDGLIDRLHQGFDVANAYPSMPVVVSGGNPRGGHTEAAAMRDWLIANGLTPGRILTEDASTSTSGNARNTAALLQRSGINAGAVLVTSPDHLRRAVADFLVARVTLRSVLASPGAAPGPAEVSAIYADARSVAGI